MEITGATLILKALDSLAVRSAVTAQNIANANSPGYKPMKVTFEDALKSAAASGVDNIRSVTPQIVPYTDAQGGSELRIDLELATANSTAGRYGALVEILNRQLQIDAIALSGVR
jgi:flagellar basal-body rod protein FlgB